MAKIKYIRVSTTHQPGGIVRQSQNADEFDKVFIDKASGKDTERPEFQKMMEYVREGDIVYFESFSRISRSLRDLLSILDELDRKGVCFVSEKENIDTSSASGRLIISVLGAINSYEREINAERRAFGFNKALEAGTVGRPSAEITEQFLEAVKQWREGKITAVKAIEISGYKKTTFYKLVKDNNL